MLTSTYQNNLLEVIERNLWETETSRLYPGQSCGEGEVGDQEPIASTLPLHSLSAPQELAKGLD